MKRHIIEINPVKYEKEKGYMDIGGGRVYMSDIADQLIRMFPDGEVPEEAAYDSAMCLSNEIVDINPRRLADEIWDFIQLRYNRFDYSLADGSNDITELSSHNFIYYRKVN